MILFMTMTMMHDIYDQKDDLENCMSIELQSIGLLLNCYAWS